MLSLVRKLVIKLGLGSVTFLLGPLLSFETFALMFLPMWDTQGRPPTLQETINHFPGASPIDGARPDADTYRRAVKIMLEVSDRYEAGSPQLFGFEHDLLAQIANLAPDVRPNLQEIVYEHYLDKVRVDEKMNSAPHKFGFDEPKNYDFYKKFSQQNEKDKQETYFDLESTEAILATVADTPEYLRNNLMEEFKLDAVDPKHYEVITQFSIKHLDNQGKTSMALNMLTLPQVQKSNYSFLELLKGNTSQKILCPALDRISSLKDQKGFDSLFQNGASYRNLISYLQSLPSQVSCLSDHGTKTYSIESELATLGLAYGGLPQASGEVTSWTSSDLQFDPAKDCPFTSLQMKSAVSNGIKSIPKTTAGQLTAAFSSDNRSCLLIIKSRKVFSKSNVDKFNVQMLYSYRGKQKSIVIHNPLNKARLLELAKSWQELKTSVVAPAGQSN